MANRLRPWTTGPFELLVHAEEHLRKGDDFDRRIALITFDDAIEVTITTYLLLHPEQRGGRSYAKSDVNSWLQNYHTKLDFLEAELASRKLAWKLGREEVIWVHSQRGEQYHGGAKGIPEWKDIHLTRDCAHWVFEVLFDVADVAQFVGDALDDRSGPVRFAKYDKAIDSSLGMIEVGPAVYYASEVLFAVDHEAYVAIGEDLCASGEADEDSAA